jgi:hypothetical protein
VELLLGQLAFALVAYDGLEPRDLPKHLREIGRQIFGDVEVIPPEARRVIALVAGARGGKSYMAAALRILHLALTVNLDSLAPGEQAFGVIIAPDPRQRDQCFGYALGAAQSCPEIARMLVGEPTPSSESFTLRRDNGREVVIEGIPAKRGGSAGRGRSLVGAALEECAFFLDADYVVNDVEVFRSVMPRVLPGGQTILSSTPWAEAGVLYEEFVANHPDPSCAAPHLTSKGTPHRAIAAHAPTLLLRDVPLTREVVAAEKQRDPVNAAREYGAQFLAIGSSAFFDAAALAGCVDPRLLLPAHPSPDPRRLVCVGADLGFVRDAAAFVAVERTAAGYRPLGLLELVPTDGRRLKPSVVFAAGAQVAKDHGATDLVADSHYAEAAREAWTEAELTMVDLPAGQGGKVEVYDVSRHAIAEGEALLPGDQPRLLEQLREVRRKPLPGGGLSIESPRKPKGGHGDLASAYVAAVWWLSKQPLPEPPARIDPRWEQPLRELKPDRRNGAFAQVARRMKR